MSNMSYCRFHNTLLDLRDCHNAIAEMIDAPNECGILSRDELYAAEALAVECCQLLQTLAEAAGFHVEDAFESGHEESRFSDAIRYIQTVVDEVNNEDEDKPVNPYDAFIGEE